MRDQRRLAAIVSADVVGLLMGRDDSATLAGLKGHRRELIDPKIAEYDGRIPMGANSRIHCIETRRERRVCRPRIRRRW